MTCSLLAAFLLVTMNSLSIFLFAHSLEKLPDENGSNGLWIGFEDPETAQAKANYIASKNLGGASIMNLDTDDFRGVCTGMHNTFPRC